MWSDYVLFLLKTLTFLVAAVVLLGVLVRASKLGGEGPNQGKLVIQHLNRVFDDIGLRMRHQMLSKKALKKVLKARKVAIKVLKSPRIQLKTPITSSLKAIFMPLN